MLQNFAKMEGLKILKIPAWAIQQIRVQITRLWILDTLLYKMHHSEYHQTFSYNRRIDDHSELLNI